MSTTPRSILTTSASTNRNILARHPLASYFGMAFAFAWIAVLPLLLSRAGIIAAELPVEPFQIAGALAGPTLAALIVTAATSGKSGVRQLLRRYVQWRAGLQWYLIVFFGALVVLTLGATVWFGTTMFQGFIQKLPQVLALYFPFLVVGVLLGPLWEEPGWRGFALPMLQSVYGPFLGTLILGLLWGVWHLPGFLGGWLPALTLSSFLAMLVTTISFSILMTWVYNNTRGSLLLMILLHSSSSAAVATGGIILPTEMPETIHAIVYSGWIPATTYAVCALILLAITRGRLSYKEVNQAAM